MDERKVLKSSKRRKTGGSIDWGEALGGKGGAIILGVAGVVLVGAGILSFVNFKPREPEIEILPVGESGSESTLWVDLGGAVEKPGVYELPSDSRLNDLLIQAGGLSAGADREWVEKNLNLAQKLSDGAKIYILGQGEASLIQSSGGQVAGSSVIGKININTASASELDSLWGIGSKRAADIIKNRPYSSAEELLSKKIIPSNVYERIKEEMAVF